MAFVGAHFTKAVAAEGAAAQLAALPSDVLHQLLGSETLQAASEVEVAQVCGALIELIHTTHAFLPLHCRDTSVSIDSQHSKRAGLLQVAVSWLEAHSADLSTHAVRLLSTVRLPPGQLRSEVGSCDLLLLVPCR